MNATIHNKSRKKELQNDHAYIHIMKYMGSKRELLPDIKKTIEKMISKESTILDLFAGTASVGAYLKSDYNIISNDIQHYSEIIAKALIQSSSTPLPTLEPLLIKIEASYAQHKKELINLLPKTYKQSNHFVSIPKGEWSESLRQEYVAFHAQFPTPLNQFHTSSNELEEVKHRYFNHNKEIYIQTSFLFAETYFSLEQSMDIDSIRYAIDHLIEDEILKSLFLTALIYAHSYCSSGTGHFAMFRDIADRASVEDTFIYRKKKVWNYFIKKLKELTTYHQYIPDRKYQTYTQNFDTLLNTQSMKSVDLIYADPPYSFVHYSRFYHAVESLILYDYAIPKFKGRYRGDRHQSPFCQKSNVVEAFETLFKSAQKHHTQVLLSYADTGMISLEKIIEIISKYGFNHKLNKIQYDHSTLGRKGHKNNTINEYLIQATF